MMSRHDMVSDTLNHWCTIVDRSTVYLRLMGAKVPALYGPSADDKASRLRSALRRRPGTDSNVLWLASWAEARRTTGQLAP